MTNFGSSSVPLPIGTVLISSEESEQPGLLPADTTVWIQVDDRAR